MKRAYRTMLPSFYAEPCWAQKRLQEDKKTKRQTELEDEKNRRRAELYVGYFSSHQKHVPDRARGREKQTPDGALCGVFSFSPKTRARQS